MTTHESRPESLPPDMPPSPVITALPQQRPRQSFSAVSDTSEQPSSPRVATAISRRSLSGSVYRKKFSADSAAAIHDLASTPAWPLPSPAPRISFDERRRLSTRFSNPGSPTFTTSIDPARLSQALPPLPRLPDPSSYQSPVSPTSNHQQESWGNSDYSRSWASGTPASSFELDVNESNAAKEANVCVVSPDDWFLQFYTEYDGTDTMTDDCPDRATLAAVQDIPIYDSDGAARPFGSIYEPTEATHERQLVIFIRHFYCGGCQAYLKAISDSISMREYLNIPVPTRIVIVGCGQPSMIRYYRNLTKCPFPIYADPSRKLFRRLGMTVTMNLGMSSPEYMQRVGTVPWLARQVKNIHNSLWKEPENPITMKDVFRGGNIMQIGGEFLFEDGQVVWCHRMKNFRNHAEVGVLRKLLQLDG